ncbi:hypothetical protein [uncultured Psychroserpens sp.]|uniref:hypothetical protein n=2 Tax=uncultured Psychroserpens sp. TaxID=255436 RepID=UPI002610BA9C|nr:hypothetical protein [uncultured Psychroserpens sp.]
MNKSMLTIICILAFSLCITAQDSKAPSIKIDIEVNGEKYQVKDGGTIKVDGKTITAKTSDYLTFNFGALVFDYPKHYAYEFEKDIGYRNWTLDGNDFIFMYFEYEDDISLNLFIQAMVERFGRESCKVTDKSTTLGKLKLVGQRIDINLIGTKLSYDIYELNTNDGKTHFISFQDSKNEDGTDSQESKDMFKIMDKTIKSKL